MITENNEFLYPTLLTTTKSIYVDASDKDHAVDQALRKFRKQYPIIWEYATDDAYPSMSDNYIRFDNGEQCTIELSVGTVRLDMSEYDYCVDIKIMFTYYSADYLTANEIILIFQELCPDLDFDRWRDSYHIETYHI